MSLEPGTAFGRTSSQRLVEREASLEGCWIHASVCQGLALIVVERPSHFFGVQLIAALASMLALLLGEMLR